MSVMSCAKKTHVNREPTKHHDFLESFTHTKLGFNQPKTVGFHHFTQKSMRKSSKIHIFPYILYYYIYNHIENHQKMEKIIEHPMQKWSQVRHLLIWGRPTVLLLLAGVHRFGAASGLWQRKRIFKVSKASRMEADVANLLFISHELAMIVSMCPLSNEQNKCYQMLYGTPGTWWI